MDLHLFRFSSTGEDTLGLLHYGIDAFACFTLEDEFRAVKRYGETRIPAGTFELRLRKAGGLHKKYADRYAFHRGMLHFQNVPNFKWIYFHTGSNDKHTAGCILVGDQVVNNHLDPGANNLLQSRLAYSRIYPIIADAIETAGAWVTVHDRIPELEG